MARPYFLITLTIALFLTSVPGYAFTSQQVQPSWSELDANQQRILAPLATRWNGMDNFRRKKWLAIAQRYPSMGQEEQIRTQHHMAEWVKLTPEERKLAREKYKSIRRTSPEKKARIKQKWQEYQGLPENEKLRLKAEAARRKSVPKTRAKPISSAKRNSSPPPATPLSDTPSPDAAR
jgi:hypothetical protein